jgi:fatty acid amide hydrolase 2
MTSSLTSPLALESATSLARRIRNGERSSAEIVEAHIARIEAVNPSLNAVVAERFEAARQEAKEADRRVAEGDLDALPPFCGVPCTIKESIALTSMPNSSGLVARATRIADTDAPPVARVRAAGAIPLGVTNTSEITCFPGGNNRLYGRTVNAHDPERTPGGSSAGEGAIIGAGGSPFGLGTDIGGSIRIPAFCNGIFGHKPSGGLVPSSGQYPLYTGRRRSINSTGPLARRAEDLMPILRIIAGPDGVDETCLPIGLGDPGAVSIPELRVIVVEPNQLRQPVEPDLRMAQQRAGYALAGRGARVEARLIRRLRDAGAISLGTFFEAGGMHLSRVLGEGRRVPVARELAKSLFGRSAHATPTLTMALLEELAQPFAKRLARRAPAGRELRAELDELLGDDGVLLYPAARFVAPPNSQELRGSAAFAYCAIWNSLELPVTEVPMGADANGMPLGVQVVGAHGRDHLCIAVAMALEQSCGGWVVPASLSIEEPGTQPR